MQAAQQPLPGLHSPDDLHRLAGLDLVPSLHLQADWHPHPRLQPRAVPHPVSGQCLTDACQTL